MDIAQTVLKAFFTLPPPVISALIRILGRNRIVRGVLRAREARALQNIHLPLKILCIADVNLGDAVNFQVVADVLNWRLPDSQVDYVHSRTAAPLIEHNPAISRNFALFTGRFIPTDEESREIRQIVHSGRYDLVLNLCPFLSQKVLDGLSPPVINFLPLVAKILTNLDVNADQPPAMIASLVQYMNEIAGMISFSDKMLEEGPSFSPTIYLDESALMERDAWMSSAGVRAGRRTVLHNPDASNQYTLINEKLQLRILRRILESDLCEQLLMASGFTFESIECRLVETLPRSLREKVTVIPSGLPVDAYTALLDVSDVFISADTGPVHLAAARKRCPSPGKAFRNQTAVGTLFGPTLSPVYGYDSERVRYADTGQNAPARIFEGKCADKTLACSLARITERCSRDACFTGVEGGSVAGFVLDVLSHGRVGRG